MKSYHPQGTPPVSFRGKQTPATGVNKCSNPDEGTLNEVSSLANEKFISSRNKYGLKESSTCWRWCVFTSHWKPDTTFRCVGLHIKWMSWSLRIINWLVEESTVEKSTLNNFRAKRKQHWWFNTNLALVSGSTNPRCGENHACPTYKEGTRGCKPISASLIVDIPKRARVRNLVKRHSSSAEMTGGSPERARMRGLSKG